MRLIRMGRKGALSSQEEDISVRNAKRNLVTIDVMCKKYTLLFVSDFNPDQQIAAANTSKPRIRNATATKKSRSTKSKSKSVEIGAVDVEKSTETPVIAVECSGEDKAPAVSTVTKPKPTKKNKVLGPVNVESPKSSKSTNEKKPEKRKRFIAEDNDISAENIPVEAVFPKLQFGINKDMCPKKRRRLQSLISPKSPSPSQFFAEKSTVFFK